MDKIGMVGMECKDCKYFENPFCHYVGQEEEGRLEGGCPYGKELGTLEDLFGGGEQEKMNKTIVFQTEAAFRKWLKDERCLKDGAYTGIWKDGELIGAVFEKGGNWEVDIY